MRKPLPIGVESYKEMVEKDYYYVDKTDMVRDILESGGKVLLFTRPRRFGKTLALSMLKTYLEDERNEVGERKDNSRCFAGKKIMNCGERCLSRMGKYPAIVLSLKSAKQPTFGMAYHILMESIQEEFRRHRYVLIGGALDGYEKEKYETILAGKAQAADYATAFAFLSRCLEKYHGQKTVILLDEYDVPLENAYFEGFYDKMVAFIRSFFESALKTNDSLELAVVTGCLRITKESIFTGLNNLEVVSILNKNYAKYFGFTHKEAVQMLKTYGVENKEAELRDWYDGYLFGDTEVYNPWSVINYVKMAALDVNAFPRPYWANTSSNSIIRELIEEADMDTRTEIENLIAGKPIERPVHEDITYEDIHESQDNLWNFLFFTGYLKKMEARFEDEKIFIRMAIPNAEVRSIYRETILTWLNKKIKGTDRSGLVRALEEGDCETFGEMVSEQLQDTISFFDYAESYYHGFLLGLLKGAGRYQVFSNRESGNGRPDILMQSPSIRGRAFILELKVAKDFRQMGAACEKALRQAEQENYRAELERIGYSDISVYGICFYRKECMAKKESQKTESITQPQAAGHGNGNSSLPAGIKKYGNLPETGL